MGELYFVSEDPSNITSRYSSRISRKVWESYLPTIQRLHEKGLTRREILKELTKRQFHPSFGQLVAQMTRRGFIRYSKPLSVSPYIQAQPPTIEIDLCQNYYEIPPPIVKDIPSGIMGVTAILLATEPVPFMHQNDSVETTHQLNQLISHLRITSDHPSGPDESPATAGENHKRRQQLLDAADVLFLGGSYAHAYHTYRDAYRIQLSDFQADFEEELLLVQAIIGCLKSAATDEQREESIDIAQHFLDGVQFPDTLNQSSAAASPPPPPYLRTAFTTWNSNACATSKAVFDLLTTYKLNRRWTTLREVARAHRMTVQEWMYMRLVRVPLWRDLVNFDSYSVSAFSIMHSGQLEPNAVFDTGNLTDILQWTAAALAEMGHYYDEQATTLRAAAASSSSSSSSSSSFASCSSSTTSPSHFLEALLFWRLSFFSRHSHMQNKPPRQCPELRVRLSTDAVFVAHSLQTASVIAHVLFRGDDDDSSSSSATHLQRLKRMQAVLEGLTSTSTLQAEESLFSLFWSGLKAKLAPSFTRRCDHAPSS